MQQPQPLTLEAFHRLIAETPAVLAYFSGEQCAVCHALKPKIKKLLQEDFPQLRFFEIDSHQQPEIAGQLSVLSVPTIIIFVEGKEQSRFTRGFSISELADNISRWYELFFS